MIGGIQPCSFIDFPGIVAAVLFTRGCNLECRYCHNPQLVHVSGEPAVSTEAALAFLETRKGKLGGVVFSGGEPSLHGSVFDLARSVRSMGFSVKLDTNGTHPEFVRRMISEKLIDYAAVDVKIAPGAGSQWLCGMEKQADSAIETLRHLVEARIPCEARTTVVKDLHDPEGLVVLANKLVSAEVRTWRLQPVETGNVLDPAAMLKPPAPEVLSQAIETASGLGIDAARASAMLCKEHIRL